MRADAVAGVLFLTAMAASLVGGGLLESGSHVHLGVFLELVNAAAVVGIAAALFPILKRQSESTALAYFVFRSFEALACVVAAVVPLLREHATPELSAVLVAARTTMTGALVPMTFGLAAALFYWLCLRSNLLPKFLAIWGLVGVAMILALNLWRGRPDAALLLALPIITNEVFLGVWLIAKGFTKS